MNGRIKELENILNEIKTVALKQEIQKNEDNIIIKPSIEIIQASEDPLKILSLQKDITELNKRLLEYENLVEMQKSTIKKFKENEKNLSSQILDLKGSVRIFCRIKPSKQTNLMLYDDNSITVDGKSFRVDGIFDSNADQKQVYNEIGLAIEAITDGYKTCVFAYGQTGSGKTYTMQGTPENEGIIFRALDDLQSKCNLYEKEGFVCEYKINYLEIYNEVLYDLIGEQQVHLIHDASGVQIKGCKDMKVKSLSEAKNIVLEANSKRKTGKTECNEKSSRSHAIFILNVCLSRDDEKIEGSLSLIDLAGSERLSESKAENERLKETQCINKSLSALGNVFNAIKKKEKHIPFRDSKLTHLMQNYLSGKSRVLMIVNINPENYNESLCSLRFASKVSECNLGAVERNITKRN